MPRRLPLRRIRWFAPPVALLGLATLPIAASSQAPPQPRPTQQAAPHIAEAQASYKAGLAAFAHNDLPAAHAAFARVVRLAPGIGPGHSALGAVLLAEGNPEAALPELQLAHRLDPTDQPALLNLALATSRLNRHAEAIPLFELYQKSAALPPEAAIAFATSLAATSQLDEAERQLQLALTQAPANASLHDSLGILLAQRQRYPDAAQQFRQATADNPGQPAPHFHLGALLLNQNDPSAAIPELQAAVRLRPDDPAYAIQLAHALSAVGRDPEAVTALRAAIAPSASIDTKYALALALQTAGEVKQSLALLQQVVAARPSDPAVLTNLGLAYIQNGDAKNAIAAYQQALRLADNPTLHENLGAAYLQQSDLTHAIEQFRQGLQLQPANPLLHYDLGLAFKLKDDLPSAIAEFLAAEQADPTLPDPPYTLGVLYMQQGRFPEAAAQLETATTLRPQNGPAWEILGNVYKQSDQPAKAIEALRRAIALLPNQPSPHISLATLLAQSGDNAAATAERKIAANLSRVAVARQRASFALDSGRLLLKRNQIPEALAQMQAAVAADPTFPEGHLGLAEALDRQGNKAEAARERLQATKIQAIP